MGGGFCGLDGWMLTVYVIIILKHYIEAINILFVHNTACAHIEPCNNVLAGRDVWRTRENYRNIGFRRRPPTFQDFADGSRRRQGSMTQLFYSEDTVIHKIAVPMRQITR